MQKLYNTYYNINNEMEVVKSPIPVSKGQSSGENKSAFALSDYASSTTTALMIGAGAGLVVSLFTRKNFIVNPLIGAAIAFAGNEFVLKGKSTKKSDLTKK